MKIIVHPIIDWIDENWVWLGPWVVISLIVLVISAVYIAIQVI